MVIVYVDAIRRGVIAAAFYQHVQEDAIRDPEYEVIDDVYFFVCRIAGDIDDAELLSLAGDFQHTIVIRRRYRNFAKDACLCVIIVLIDDFAIVVFFLRLLKELEVFSSGHDLQDARESL